LVKTLGYDFTFVPLLTHHDDDRQDWFLSESQDHHWKLSQLIIFHVISINVNLGELYNVL